MNTMFYGASSFNQPLNDWQVDKVTHMYSMFAEASSFNQPLGSWSIGRGWKFSGMFEGAKAFKSSKPVRRQPSTLEEHCDACCVIA